MISKSQIFRKEVFPRVYCLDSEEWTSKHEEFFTTLQNYKISEKKVETSLFRYCGGDSEPCDINYYRMIFPGYPFPIKQKKCVCGHDIQKNCYITNKNKTILAILGCCCIKKFWGKKVRQCEVCDKIHTSRTLNMCKPCMEQHYKEEKKKIEKERRERQEKWNIVLEKGKDILKLYRVKYGKVKWYSESDINRLKFDCKLCHSEVRYPYWICGDCHSEKTDERNKIRLQLMVDLWPNFSKRIEENMQNKIIARTEDEIKQKEERIAIRERLAKEKKEKDEEARKIYLRWQEQFIIDNENRKLKRKIKKNK
jgi:hypothetical protein